MKNTATGKKDCEQKMNISSLFLLFFPREAVIIMISCVSGGKICLARDMMADVFEK